MVALDDLGRSVGEVTIHIGDDLKDKPQMVHHILRAFREVQLIGVWYEGSSVRLVLDPGSLSGGKGKQIAADIKLFKKQQAERQEKLASLFSYMDIAEDLKSEDEAVLLVNVELLHRPTSLLRTLVRLFDGGLTVLRIGMLSQSEDNQTSFVHIIVRGDPLFSSEYLSLQDYTKCILLECGAVLSADVNRMSVRLVVEA